MAILGIWKLGSFVKKSLRGKAPFGFKNTGIQEYRTQEFVYRVAAARRFCQLLHLIFNEYFNFVYYTIS